MYHIAVLGSEYIIPAKNISPRIFYIISCYYYDIAKRCCSLGKILFIRIFYSLYIWDAILLRKKTITPTLILPVNEKVLNGSR